MARSDTRAQLTGEGPLPNTAHMSEPSDGGGTGTPSWGSHGEPLPLTAEGGADEDAAVWDAQGRPMPVSTGGGGPAGWDEQGRPMPVPGHGGGSADPDADELQDEHRLLALEEDSEEGDEED